MNKKTISFIKRKFPQIFYLITQSYFAVRVLQQLDRFRFWYCMVAKKPYFGVISLAGQTWEERKEYMRNLVIGEIKKRNCSSFNILEIGSWAGNSAVLWAEAIKSCGISGKVICIDPWEPYFKEDESSAINIAPLIMQRALRKERVFKLFLHNIKTSHHLDIVKPIKGLSDDVLPFLKEKYFNLIFLDGNHSYSGVKRDLVNVECLLDQDGLICGDDLDLQVGEIDLDVARKNKERNMIFDQKTKREFHPGVSLAVYDFFGSKVSNYNGFWVMRKTENQWEKVEISK